MSPLHIETDLERDRATIVTLNTALTNTNTALATATHALANARGPPPPAGERPPRRESIPKPHEFPGSQDHLRLFIAQLRTKFLADAHKFVGVQHRLAYAVGFLKGKAYEQILPLIDEGNINIASAEALITLLEKAFGDPDRVCTAERNLQSLRQKNRNLPDHLADFQQYAAALSCNDSAKRTSLYQGLSAELKDALVTLNTPDELDQYIICSNVWITRSVPTQLNERGHLLHGDHLPRPRPRHQNQLLLLRLPPPLQVLKRAPWTFWLDDAAYHTRKVKIACDTANASTAGEHTTWLDNVQTDKVTSEPMLLRSVHLRQWFLKTLVQSPNTRKTNSFMYSPRPCHGTRIAFFFTFFIWFIS